MHRMGMVIGIRPEKIAEYKALHETAWPAIIDRLSQSNVKIFSIFLREPENLLFGYWEYHGRDFEADMAAIAEDPDTRRWWVLTDRCQTPLDTHREGEQWATMDLAFHMD